MNELEEKISELFDGMYTRLSVETSNDKNKQPKWAGNVTLTTGYNLSILVSDCTIEFSETGTTRSNNWVIRLEVDINQDMIKEKRETIIHKKINELFDSFFPNLKIAVLKENILEGRVWNGDLLDGIESYVKELNQPFPIQVDRKILNLSSDIETIIESKNLPPITHNPFYFIDLIFKTDEYSCILTLPYSDPLNDKVVAIVVSTLDDMIATFSELKCVMQ
ncbi:hypothetical protein PTI45_04650 [Paenibacillus nuruki]|uniref:Uncharacterized protein n=1 Tax=Paenibacillus nuruki TaxID=1886670 RepID=A0A1E3KX28_9BACL|nr:hypothetical protein [Paenibacillus nuruki]ODP26014.1 hypothetical protein PTI45_04650 [Paenibacillus nuruki]